MGRKIQVSNHVDDVPYSQLPVLTLKLPVMTSFLFYNMYTHINNTPNIMDNKIPAFTFFTFFFLTVSSARLALDPPATNPSAVRSEASRESAASAVEKAKSDSEEATANNRLPEPEKTTNDLTARTNFSRFHPINRHFHGPPLESKYMNTNRRHCRKSVTQYRIPRTEISGKNDEITARRSDNSNPEIFRGEAPSNRLKVKQQYGTRRHHNNQRSNRDKLKNLIRQHKEKKRDEETRFMKSIRKFLKHTFY